MEKTKLEKLARLSGKATSKALDALGKHGFDIRGKLSARSTECPVGLLLQSRNRASDGQSRNGKRPRRASSPTRSVSPTAADGAGWPAEELAFARGRMDSQAFHSKDSTGLRQEPPM